MQFDPELLARLQPKTPRVGMADEQIAVAMHTGAEFSLAAAGATTSASR